MNPTVQPFITLHDRVSALAPWVQRTVFSLGWFSAPRCRSEGPTTTFLRQDVRRKERYARRPPNVFSGTY